MEPDTVAHLRPHRKGARKDSCTDNGAWGETRAVVAREKKAVGASLATFRLSLPIQTLLNVTAADPMTLSDRHQTFWNPPQRGKKVSKAFEKVDHEAAISVVARQTSSCLLPTDPVKAQIS